MHSTEPAPLNEFYLFTYMYIKSILYYCLFSTDAKRSAGSGSFFSALYIKNNLILIFVNRKLHKNKKSSV